MDVPRVYHHPVAEESGASMTKILSALCAVLIVAIAVPLRAQEAPSAATAGPNADPLGYPILKIFSEICLGKFPDDDAVAAAMTERGAKPLSGAEVGRLLRNNPGIGWTMETVAGPQVLTIEKPPFHACAIRATPDALFNLNVFKTLVNGFLAPRQQKLGDPMMIPSVGGMPGVSNAFPVASQDGQLLLLEDTFLVMASGIRDSSKPRGFSIEMRVVRQEGRR